MRQPLTEDELMHFGIKGMKWGVRRFQNPDGTRTPAGLKRYSDKFFRKTRQKHRVNKIAQQQKSERDRVSEMSDEEIDQKINRLRKEKELINLMNDTKVQQVGKKKLSDALRDTGSKLLKDASYKVGMNYVEKFMKSKDKAEQLKKAADKLRYQQDKFNFEKAQHDFERTKAQEGFESDKERLKYNQDRLKYFKDLEKYMNGDTSTAGDSVKIKVKKKKR